VDRKVLEFVQSNTFHPADRISLSRRYLFSSLLEVVRFRSFAPIGFSAQYLADAMEMCRQTPRWPLWRGHRRVRIVTQRSPCVEGVGSLHSQAGQLTTAAKQVRL